MTETCSIENIGFLLHFVIGHAAKEVNNRLSHESTKVGLTTTQIQVLMTLLYKGPCTVSDIITAVISSSGNIDMVISNLMKNGLISKFVDEEDKRRRVISLTTKGREKILAMQPRYAQILADHFSNLSAEEKKLLIVLLEKAHGNPYVHERGSLASIIRENRSQATTL